MNAIASTKRPVCFLFDNGSLRAEATLSLRATAERLAQATGAVILPTSLLHSNAIAATELGGTPALLLEQALRAHLEKAPAERVVLLPLFFGPSGALEHYLPKQLGAITGNFAMAKIVMARCLVQPAEADARVAAALAEETRLTIQKHRLKSPKVVMVDHGSPQRKVTAVRDHLGQQLRGLLGSDVEDVRVASMEKREGPDYAFNDPLLRELLTTPPYDEGEVVVVLQFLAPGRHAGSEGDIAQICADASQKQKSLHTYITEPIGNSQQVIDVLADRYREAARAL
jgi:sirohydrochlorin ferrochelatase